MKKKLQYCSLIILLSLLSSIAIAQVNKKTVDAFLNDTAVITGHAGISIYEPATGKYLYNYNAEKNFTPSSNVKLFTLYAGMKYLGDSLKGVKISETDTTISIVSTGDPTLLHPDFKDQPVIDYLRHSKKIISLLILQTYERRYGEGWAWDDYAEDFMPERSAMPVYGNLVTFGGTKSKYSYFPKVTAEKNVNFDDWNDWGSLSLNRLLMARNFSENIFNIPVKGKTSINIQIPFITSDSLTIRLLADTLKRKIWYAPVNPKDLKFYDSYSFFKPFYSRPVDSLFRPMMFNSDNFFAEQTLLMVSNEKFGYMSDEIIIDSLLKTDFKDIPTKPRWVDGSGLSRYNLFSPKDFIYILNKLKDTFGLERMKSILPGAGKGTLTNYYGDITGSIFAKTGSMSNNVSLSGYLVTKKNKLLLFSVIINNFSGSGKSGRRAIEKLLLDIWEKN